MKLHVIGLAGVMFGAAASVGCGPGLGHHGQWAKAPSPVSTTAVTSAPSFPATRLAPLPWEEDDATDESPAPRTWGTDGEPARTASLHDYSKYSEEYGF